MNWDWVPQQQPILPQALVTIGAPAQALLQRLQGMPAEQLGHYSAIAANELLIILGKSADLPWIDDAAYAAPSKANAECWLPTTMKPSLPMELLAKTVLRQARRSPVLLWPHPEWIIPLNRQHTISVDWLTWLQKKWQ